MEAIIKQLILNQKLKLLVGIDNWNIYDLDGKIKQVSLSDGPNGLRKVFDDKTIKSTAMPNICVLANSWDRNIARLDAETIAEDCIDNNVDVLLAPGVI